MVAIDPAVRTVVDAAATASRPIIGIFSVRMHLGTLPECEGDEANQG